MERYFFVSREKESFPAYKIRSDKILQLLQKIYIEKEQLVHHREKGCEALIVMIADLEEMVPSWLQHAQAEGVHPLQRWVSEQKVPTALLGAGHEYVHSSMASALSTCSPT